MSMSFASIHWGGCSHDKEGHRRDVALCPALSSHTSFVTPFVSCWLVVGFQLLDEVVLSFCFFRYFVILALPPSIIFLNGMYRRVQCLPRSPSCLRSFVRPLLGMLTYVCFHLSMRPFILHFFVCVKCSAFLMSFIAQSCVRVVMFELLDSGAAGRSTTVITVTAVIMFAAIPWFYCLYIRFR